MNASTHGQEPSLVLASASPRRRQLLTDAGYDFEVIAPAVDESAIALDAGGPAGLAEHLSLLKAREVAARVERGVVLGADTVVAADGAIFGKPADANDARRILSLLLNTPHQVITGVTLLDAATLRLETQHAVTRIKMTPMTAAQLDDYIAGGLWQGKAGAYGVQDHNDAFVREMDGSFSNVVGLPLECVAEMLTRWGVYPARAG